jgi:hypothetical protein
MPSWVRAATAELHEPTLADSVPSRARMVFMNDLDDEFEPWLEPLANESCFAGVKMVESPGRKQSRLKKSIQSAARKERR